MNQKENQIMFIKEDKNTLININNKLIFENNLLKQHINKLIINIDKGIMVYFTISVHLEAIFIIS